MKESRRILLSAGTYSGPACQYPLYRESIVLPSKFNSETIELKDGTAYLIKGIEVITEWPILHLMSIELLINGSATSPDRLWYINDADKTICNTAFAQGKHVYYWNIGHREIPIQQRTRFMFKVNEVQKQCELSIRYYGVEIRKV